MSALPARILTHGERRMLDRDAAILALVSDQVRPASLSPRREIELIQAGADRIRHALDLLESATIAAAALEREDRAADAHVRGHCPRCQWWTVKPCAQLRGLRRRIEAAHQSFRRAMLRLNQGAARW